MITVSIQQGIRAANRSLPALRWYLVIFFTIAALGFGYAALLSHSEIPIRHLPRTINALSPSVVPSSSLIGPIKGQLFEEDLAHERNLLAKKALRWWPTTGLYFLVLIATCIWLYGGQIGFIHKVLNNQNPGLADFRAPANRVFLPIAVALSITACFWMFALKISVFLLRFDNRLLAIFISYVEAVLGIGLMLWLIVIVIDKEGPISALRRSFSFCKRHGGQYLGICLLFGLISIGLRLTFAYIDMVAIGPANALISFAIHETVYFYLQFAFTAELIQFYETKKRLVGTP